METKLYLIRLGEISLKGQNRKVFEGRLKNNIKDCLRPWENRIAKEKGRLYLHVDAACPDELIVSILSRTFGIVGFAPALRVEKDMESLTSATDTLLALPPFDTGKGTFKIEARRSDKSFPLNSHELSCTLGGYILDRKPEMKVNVKKPDMVLNCEVRDKIYLYASDSPGQGGLPVGTAGKGMLLLSGGIDSPVAGYMMASRGLALESVYFHAYPYTSDEALEKVKTLASLIAPYTHGMHLHVVPFTKAQLWMRQHSNVEEQTLMLRASMMKVAQALSLMRGAQALVTGEALGQVASQTLESMSFTDSMTDMLVLRPLVGMEKQAIIHLARTIGTYETSILPYEDCCVIFSPKHPLVKPDRNIEREHFEKMGIETLLEEAVEKTVTYHFGYDGTEYVPGEGTSDHA
ncbi:tRNA uracil 4-sulfurtransferase ThiI [Parasphaerochaeta coccoides]|uniref:Probable tRNA sulfurtransferase n=1 Tax=Parasphaerochaeta coccoides (strain ATCC BAA-1237 / DSM 17374 / SPN1) TaxID=760011 RepID=F4GJB2_PARC1|nr:tRNA uracil 4-sulfurtransferase ThiI [Parasphaerochaeta coccoides]AEC01752.1 tRNA sulfurtransferase [Parasphaerochaeta coccoides DSM 17374]